MRVVVWVGVGGSWAVGATVATKSVDLGKAGLAAEDGAVKRASPRHGKRRQGWQDHEGAGGAGGAGSGGMADVGSTAAAPDEGEAAGLQGSLRQHARLDNDVEVCDLPPTSHVEHSSADRHQPAAPHPAVAQTQGDPAPAPHGPHAGPPRVVSPSEIEALTSHQPRAQVAWALATCQCLDMCARLQRRRNVPSKD